MSQFELPLEFTEAAQEMTESLTQTGLAEHKTFHTQQYLPMSEVDQHAPDLIARAIAQELRKGNPEAIKDFHSMGSRTEQPSFERLKQCRRVPQPHWSAFVLEC